MRIALISCSKTKRSGVHPACELYCSVRFRLAWKYAAGAYDKTGVLSAKHGLIIPERRIRAYDDALGSKTSAERSAWARKVARQIRAQFPIGSEIHFLCSRAYRETLAELLSGDYAVAAPLAHMRRAEQLRWLKQAAGA